MRALKAWFTPYRREVLSRLIAASLGGYSLVNLANLALSYILPLPQYQALLLAMMLSFLFYTLAIIWVFAVKSAAKAWLGLLAVAIPLSVVSLLFTLGGG